MAVGIITGSGKGFRDDAIGNRNSPTRTIIGPLDTAHLLNSIHWLERGKRREKSCYVLGALIVGSVMASQRKRGALIRRRRSRLAARP